MDAEVDEYLWLLNGELNSMHWEYITEELHIRRRLAEILAESNKLAQRLQELGAEAPPAHRTVAQGRHSTARP